MGDWMRFPSGQHNFIKEDHPKRVAWVRKSTRGWDWIIQDLTGRQLDMGTSKTVAAAKVKAVNWIATEGLSDQQLARLQRERRDAGFGDDEII
jgi:hypothetical protein